MSKPSDHNPELPAKPERPAPEECCGGGCVPCVYDYYYEAMEKWLALKQAHSAAKPPQEDSADTAQ
jgi:hypothetical protein